MDFNGDSPYDRDIPSIFELARKPRRIHTIVDRDSDVKRFAYAYFKSVDDGTEALKKSSENDEEWDICFVSSIDDLVDEGFGALIRLYLLADKLQDLPTTNIVIDEIFQFSVWIGAVPSCAQISIAYSSTVEGCPLRALIRNLWVCASKQEGLQRLRDTGYPSEFLQDIAVELLRAKLDMEVRLDEYDDDADDENESFVDQCNVFSETYHLDPRKCLYHQHDKQNPKCDRPKPSSKSGKKAVATKGKKKAVGRSA